MSASSDEPNNGASHASEANSLRELVDAASAALALGRFDPFCPIERKYVMRLAAALDTARPLLDRRPDDVAE